MWALLIFLWHGFIGGMVGLAVLIFLAAEHPLGVFADCSLSVNAYNCSASAYTWWAIGIGFVAGLIFVPLVTRHPSA